MTSDTNTYLLPVPTQCFIADEGHTTPLPTRYLELAHRILTDAGQEAVEISGVLLIAESGLTAGHLFFVAALHEPTEWELDEFFEDFIIRCVVSPGTMEAR